MAETPSDKQAEKPSEQDLGKPRPPHADRRRVDRSKDAADGRELTRFDRGRFDCDLGLIGLNSAAVLVGAA